MPPPVSACLIVRDEERRLPDCLKSLEGYVNEVIVVDTGSIDSTPKVAVAAGARLFHQSWRNDFSTPRNLALSKASGDWIFQIDADERLEAPDRPEWDVLLGDRAVAAYTCLMSSLPGYTAERVIRLFRRRPEVRYSGLIHESVTAGLAVAADRDNLEIRPGPVRLSHTGYTETERMASKYCRDLPLLRAELDRDPGNSLNWRHLALTLHHLGRTGEAGRAWQRGLEVVRAKKRPGAGDAGLYADLAAVKAARSEPVRELLAEALAWFDRDPTLTWLSGRRELAERNYGPAEAAFNRLLQWGREGGFSRATAHRRDILGPDALSGLALSRYRQGDFGAAARYYEQAVYLVPGDARLKLKRDLCRRLTGG